MLILGIDYGKRKIGIALSEPESLAQPAVVLRVSSEKDAVEKVAREIEKIKPQEVVVGLSEGSMKKMQKNFAGNLQEAMSVPIKFWDETLSTYDAQILARETGMSKTKRKKQEDAFAAAIMLQSYIDTVYAKTKTKNS